MSTEELLKPRYKVIADYPNSPFKIGFIVEFSEIYPFSGLSFDQNDTILAPEYFDKYPHLFKPLQWWENREAADMPLYLKDKHGEVWKVWEYTNKHASYVLLKKNFRDENCPYGDHSLYELFPATETEYTSHHKIVK